jgi:phosphoglycerol transferase MdoB-like AlkP superfamily enzyme
MNGYFFVKSCIYHLQNDFTINNSDLDGSSLSDLLSLFEPEPAISFVPVLVIALLLLYQLFRKETVAIFGFTSMNIMAVGLLGISLFGASLLVTGYW